MSKLSILIITLLMLLPVLTWVIVLGLIQANWSVSAERQAMRTEIFDANDVLVYSGLGLCDFRQSGMAWNVPYIRKIYYDDGTCKIEKRH